MKKLIFIFMSLAIAVSAIAQETNRDANGKIQYGPYETNRFVDNWFVEVGAGVQAPFDDFKTYNFGGLVVNANVGKWIDPVWGFRLGWQGLTTGNLNNKVTFKDSFDGNHAFNYVHGDFMFNFSNLVAGYKETRVVDVVPYLSAGAAFNKSSRCLGVGAGVQVPIRISNVVKIAPQLQVLATNSHIVGGKGVVAHPSASVNVVVNLGKNNWTRKATTVSAYEVRYANLSTDYKTLDNKYNEVKSKSENTERENARLTDENARLEKELAVARAVKEETPNDFVVYFEIGKSVLSEVELAHLDYFVNTVVVNHKKVTFHVFGATDSVTGSERRNAELRNKRAQYIYDILTKKYGLSNIAESDKSLVDIDESVTLSRAALISVDE